MGKKYIIELEDKPFHKEDGDFLYRVKGFDSLVFDMTGISKLTPYTELDTEKVREEVLEAIREEVLEAVSRIYDIPQGDRGGIFPKATYYVSDIVRKYSASEIIEKIRQYEQEQEQDGLRQNIQTIVDQCGYTLDEIAAVLEKMRGEKDG